MYWKKDIITKAYNKFRKHLNGLYAISHNNIHGYSGNMLHTQFLTALLKYGSEGPFDNSGGSQGFWVHRMRTTPQSMYYIMDQGHNFQNLLFPEIHHQKYNHQPPAWYTLTTEIHNFMCEVPGRRNKNRYEWVTHYGHWNWLCNRGLA